MPRIVKVSVNCGCCNSGTEGLLQVTEEEELVLIRLTDALKNLDPVNGQFVNFSIKDVRIITLSKEVQKRDWSK